jgi:hypothetical protein
VSDDRPDDEPEIVDPPGPDELEADGEVPQDTDLPPEPQAPAKPPVGRVRRVLGFLSRNAYLTLIVAAGLVLTKAIDFSPPEQVRVGKTDVAKIVGDAPAQDFSHELSHPQSVQVRATLRLYPDNELQVSMPDPDMDDQGRMLSQPVVTTILGMNATTEQTVRLEDGELEIDVTINATPRLDPAKKSKKGKKPPPLILESEVSVKSRRKQWWARRPQQRVHLDSRAFLEKVEENGHRIVFTVDQHLFSLDIELHRAFGPLPDSTFAGSK